MVVGAYYPEMSGGGLQCRTLVRALCDRVDFTVLTTTSQPGEPLESEVDGVRVCRIFLDPRKPWTKVRALAQFVRVAGRLAFAADIFHFHGFTQKMLLLIPLAKLLRRPIIEKMTSVGWDDALSIRQRRGGAVMARAFAMADRFVSISPAMTERMTRGGVGASAIVPIPNGVDVARFAPVDEVGRSVIRARLGLPASAWIVTFIGFWSLEKNPDLLFEAWLRVVRETGVESELLFVGATAESHLETDSALVARIRERARAEGVADRLRFVEHTHDVPLYLQASNAFVLPSTREGLPNALLEGMATGLPCVCTRIPGVTDWLIDDGKSGFLVPPNDVDAITCALKRLARNEGLAARVGATAREVAVERFAIGQVADRYFELYRTLCPASWREVA